MNSLIGRWCGIATPAPPRALPPLLLLVVLALLPAGPGCSQVVSVSSEKPDEELDFSSPPTAAERDAAEDLEYYLEQVITEAWTEAYKRLSHELQREIGEKEYRERQQANMGSRLVGYEVDGVRVDPDNPRRALARVKLRISDGKTTETWVELWTLVHTGAEWKLSATPRL